MFRNTPIQVNPTEEEINTMTPILAAHAEFFSVATFNQQKQEFIVKITEDAKSSWEKHKKIAIFLMH